MLLIHGWGGSSAHWIWTFHGLADVSTMYAPDLPGYGETPPLRGPTNIARMAACIIEFADAMGLEQFDLNGHSFGGGVAVYLAAHYPERVRRLILTCYGTLANDVRALMMDQLYAPLSLGVQFWHPWLRFSQPWINLWQFWLVNAGYMPLVPWSAARPFFYTMPSDAEMLREGYREFVMMDQQTALENSISLGNPALRSALQQLAMPTLFIAGVQDMVVWPDLVANAQRVVRNSRIAWIHQCGHVPMIERAESYNDALRAFVISSSISDASTNRHNGQVALA
jgi:pimeloyl-ACP methyl ester carboxylesterase